VEADPKEAVRWCALAAEGGVPRASLFLGDAYYHGWGEAPDIAKALEFYEKAAQGGDPHASLALGYACEKGEGQEKDLAMAFAFYERAALAGLPEGLFMTAEAYRKGEGVEADLEKALDSYLKAAAKGGLEAQRRLYQLGLEDPAFSALLERRAAVMAAPEGPGAIAQEGGADGRETAGQGEAGGDEGLPGARP
jgi:TPR repeat protein